MPLMLSLDQIQRELKAILDFDLIFLAASKHYREEIVGFEVRQCRRQELLRDMESLRVRRPNPSDPQPLPIPQESPNVADVGGVGPRGCRQHRVLRPQVPRPKRGS
jgi:hypothetical protein